MSRSFPGFSRWVLLFLLAACGVAAGLHFLKDTLLPAGEVAAELHGQPITRQELEMALREELWKRGEAWSNLRPEARKLTRGRVLENLVNSRLVRAHRSEVPTDPAAAKREAERMQRQFADEGEFPRRLAAQQLTPQELQTRIEEAQRDEAWIAAQIQPRLREISDQDARDWYDKYKETLRIPQAWHAAHIFLTRHDASKPDRTTEMREIQRQLQDREKTFAQLAQERSEDDRSKARGGDLGWFTHERMPADFIAAVEKLRIGQASEPVQTQLGWHIILLLERRASRVPPFAEVQAEIRALLTSRQREEAVRGLLAELRGSLQQPVVYHAEIVDRTEPAP